MPDLIGLGLWPRLSWACHGWPWIWIWAYSATAGAADWFSWIWNCSGSVGQSPKELICITFRWVCTKSYLWKRLSLPTRTANRFLFEDHLMVFSFTLLVWLSWLECPIFTLSSVAKLLYSILHFEETFYYWVSNTSYEEYPRLLMKCWKRNLFLMFGRKIPESNDFKVVAITLLKISNCQSSFMSSIVF